MPKGGYPDTGSGRYSKKLSYKDWFIFNQFQRIHYNFLEQLTQTVTFTLIAGISFTYPTIVLSGLYVLARLAYSIGYAT